MWELIALTVAGMIGGPIGLAMTTTTGAAMMGRIAATRWARGQALMPVLGPIVSMSGVKMDGPFIFTPPQYALLTRMLRSCADENDPVLIRAASSLQAVAVTEEMVAAGWDEESDPTLYLLALGRKQVEGLSPKDREAYGLA